MSSARPSSPRRPVPPLPPYRAALTPSPYQASAPVRPSRHTSIGSIKIGEDEINTGIAARIANLQLGHLSRTQVGLAKPPVRRPHAGEIQVQQPEPEPESTLVYVQDDHKAQKPANPRGPPPPIPPRSPRLDSVDLARALARRPPPPPVPATSSGRIGPSPPLPPDTSKSLKRRLPPVPSRLPTPPPELEPESEPEPEYETQEEEISHDAAESSYSQSTQCLHCRDFSHVDAHAAQFSRDISMDELAYSLTEPFESETEKARAIFTWLHYNIAYDAESFFAGTIQPATAESTLSSGLAVCEGYAGLFESLGSRAGLQAHKVIGHGKGVGYVATPPGQPVPKYNSGHAWNCVLMDGEWHLIDGCWGAGVLQGMTYEQRFAPSWFTSTPTEFGKRHFPEDLTYQLIPAEDGGPISWEDYIMAPEDPMIFIDFHKLDLSEHFIQPAVKYIQGGRRHSFHIFRRCEHMSTAESDNFVYIIATCEDTRVPLRLNAAGGWSTDVYIPHGGEVSLYSVTIVGGKDAKGLGVEKFNKANGRQSMSFGGLARWTVV